ncbi:MAG TPA: type II CAAX endopeptidase family protein [Bacteroidales bacterium]|nr:type II CAAX endopeptidase family protein [Bacteroidales bacterium]
MMKRLAKQTFTDTFHAIQKEHEEYIRSNGNGTFNKKVLIIAVIVCISLACIEYIGKNDGYYGLLRFMRFLGFTESSDRILFFIEHETNHQLFSLGYWVFSILIFYFLVPALIIKFVFKEKLRDYGLYGGSVLKERRIFTLFLIIMFPLILIFSTTESFQLRYPFYHLQSGEPLWPNFFIWQLFYFFQFIALEFFFRGFMVHGLKKQFGYYSIFIMTIPYCMIHFGKPFPETMAAIIAGVILGTLSLKSRSIWMGVAIHYIVALSMDLSALWQKGFWIH